MAPFLALLLALAATPSFAVRTLIVKKPDLDPAEAARLVASGTRKLDAGQYDAAIGLFEEATQNDPDSSHAYFRLGDAYYQRAFRRGPSEPADRIDAQSAVESYQTALALDPKLRETRESFQSFHGMAQSYMALGRYREALDAFKRAAALEPGNPMPNLYAAQLRYKLGDMPLSSANLLVSAKRARRQRQIPALAKLVRTDPLFDGLLSVPQNQVILKAYEEVQKGKLSEPRADTRIREAQGGMLALRDAPSDLRDSLNDAPVYRRLAAASRLASGLSREEAAEAAAAAAQQADPAEPSSVWMKIGASYRSMGQGRDAVKALERAVAETPEDPNAHYQLALSYAADGQKAKALTALSWALSTTRDPEELRRMLLLARTDPGLEPLRVMARYREILLTHSSGLALRRP